MSIKPFLKMPILVRIEQSEKIMAIHIGRVRSEKEKQIEAFVLAAVYKADHFYFESEGLIHEVFNPTAMKLLSKIKNRNFNEYDDFKIDIDRLLVYEIIKLEEHGFIFNYDLIKFEFDVHI